MNARMCRALRNQNRNFGCRDRQRRNSTLDMKPGNRNVPQRRSCSHQSGRNLQPCLSVHGDSMARSLLKEGEPGANTVQILMRETSRINPSLSRVAAYSTQCFCGRRRILSGRQPGRRASLQWSWSRASANRRGLCRPVLPARKPHRSTCGQRLCRVVNAA